MAAGYVMEDVVVGAGVLYGGTFWPNLKAALASGGYTTDRSPVAGEVGETKDPFLHRRIVSCCVFVAWVR